MWRGDDPVREVAAGAEAVDVHAVRVGDPCLDEHLDSGKDTVGIKITVGHTDAPQGFPHHLLAEDAATGVVGLEQCDRSLGPVRRVALIVRTDAEPRTRVEVYDQRPGPVP